MLVNPYDDPIVLGDHMYITLAKWPALVHTTLYQKTGWQCVLSTTSKCLAFDLVCCYWLGAYGHGNSIHVSFPVVSCCWALLT